MVLQTHFSTWRWMCRNKLGNMKAVGWAEGLGTDDTHHFPEDPTMKLARMKAGIAHCWELSQTVCFLIKLTLRSLSNLSRICLLLAQLLCGFIPWIWWGRGTREPFYQQHSEHCVTSLRKLQRHLSTLPKLSCAARSPVLLLSLQLA